MKKTIIFILLLSIAAVLTADSESFREYQRLRFDAGGSILGYGVHEYNEDGKKSETRWYNDEGDYETVTVYEYDRRGNLVRESHYDRSETVLFYYTSYEYNDEGTLERSSDYNSDGTMVLWIEYAGIDEGSDVASEEYGYAADGTPVFRVENDTDSKDRKTDTRVFEIGADGESPGSHAVYTYNSRNNLIKTEIFTPEGELIWYMDHKWEAVE